MIKNLKDLEKVTGIDAEALRSAIESTEEVTLEIKTPQTEFNPDSFKDDERFNSWKDNYKAENFIMGRETMIKEARNELNLDFEGKKLENLLGAYKSKVMAEAKIEPEKRVTELESDINKLRDQLNEKEQKYNGLSEELVNTKFQYTLQDKLTNTLSSIGTETVIPQKDIMSLYKANRKIHQGENQMAYIVDPITNEPLKDELRSPVKIEDDFKTFAMNYIKKPEGGRGISNEPESKKGSLEAFDKRMQSEGISVSSMEYNKKMQEAISSGEIDID